MKKHFDKKLFFLIQIFGIFVLYLFFSIILFFPRWQHATTHYGPPDLDTDSTIWYQWARIFTERKQINFAYTNELVAFPFGYDVSYIPYFSLVYEVNIAAMKLLGGGWSAIIFISNISTLLTLPLGAFAAFTLTYYLTRKKYSSFISGLIFGFSFYHIMMMGGSLSLNHIELIPIFYLFFLYFLDKPNWKSLLLSSLAFILLFMSNAYWAFFSMVFTPIFFCFYGAHTLKKRLLLLAVYYPSVLFLTIISNLDYVWSQLYNLSPYHLQHVFPKTGTVKDQLLNTTSFFSPSLSSVFKPWYYSKGEHFLGYTALGASLAAFFVKKKHRNYGIFLACLLFAILLASKTSPFLAINEVYFKFFRAFRAVSRLVILASLFLGVVTAYSLDVLHPFLEKRLPKKWRKQIILAIGLMMPAMILLESFTLTGMNRRLTSFEHLAQLYQPLQTNQTVKRIINYPLEVAGDGDGFPHNYVLVGQVIHQKALVGGISRLTPQARGFREQVKDISDPRTITTLEENGIDTIVIYSNMYEYAERDTQLLQKDPRVQYLGTFEQPKDKNTYVSANDLSRKIAIFQVKAVLEKNAVLDSNQSSEVEIIGDSGQFEVKKISAHEYLVQGKHISSPVDLILHEPYSTKWQLFPDQPGHWQKFFAFLESPVLGAAHQISANSENSWKFDPQTNLNMLPSQSYTLNSDGSINLNLRLYFEPVLLQEMSDNIRVGFFILAGSLLVTNSVYSRLKRKNLS